MWHSRAANLEDGASAPIPREAIIQDASVVQFSHAMAEQVPNETEVAAMERNYFFALMTELFDFGQLLILFDALLRLLQEHFYKRIPATLQDCQNQRLLLQQKMVAVALKFRPQFETLIALHDDYATHEHLAERVEKGARYFLTEVKAMQHFMRQLSVPTENKTVGTRVMNTIKDIKDLLHLKKRLLTEVALEGFSVVKYQQVRAIASIEEPDAPQTESKRRKRKTDN